MEILVEDKVIETTNIVDIVDIEAHKQMFLNREAGFIIRFRDNTSMTFGEAISYDSYPSEIAAKKDRWKVLEDKVRAQWKEDMKEIPTFKA